MPPSTDPFRIDLRTLGVRIDHTVTGAAVSAAGTLAPVVRPARKPFLAAIGAGEAVLDRICELPGAVLALRRPSGLGTTYDALSERGEQAVGRLRAHAHVSPTNIQHEPEPHPPPKTAKPAARKANPARRTARPRSASKPATRRRTLEE
ncbi:MAG: hypothetical protein ACR2F6_13810 [Mycobacteriales bacterium]